MTEAKRQAFHREKGRYFCGLVWNDIRVMCKWVRYWQHDPYWHEFSRGIVRGQVETLRMCRNLAKYGVYYDHLPAGGMRIIVGCVFEGDAQVVHSPANAGFAEHDNHAKIGEWGELAEWGNQDCDKFEI